MRTTVDREHFLGAALFAAVACGNVVETDTGHSSSLSDAQPDRTVSDARTDKPGAFQDANATVDVSVIVTDARAMFDVNPASCGDLPDECLPVDAAGDVYTRLRDRTNSTCPTTGNAGCSRMTIFFDSQGCVTHLEPDPSHPGWTRAFLDCFHSMLAASRWPCAADTGVSIPTGGSCTK